MFAGLLVRIGVATALVDPDGLDGSKPIELYFRRTRPTLLGLCDRKLPIEVAGGRDVTVTPSSKRPCESMDDVDICESFTSTSLLIVDCEVSPAAGWSECECFVLVRKTTPMKTRAHPRTAMPKISDTAKIKLRWMEAYKRRRLCQSERLQSRDIG